MMVWSFTSSAGVLFVCRSDGSMRRRSRGVSSASRSNARRVRRCWKCVPGASDASGALMRITSYGFGGFTARYRLSFFFFFSEVAVGVAVWVPSPFTGGTSERMDELTAEAVSPFIDAVEDPEASETATTDPAPRVASSGSVAEAGSAPATFVVSSPRLGSRPPSVVTSMAVSSTSTPALVESSSSMPPFSAPPSASG